MLVTNQARVVMNADVAGTNHDSFVAHPEINTYVTDIGSSEPYHHLPVE